MNHTTDLPILKPGEAKQRIRRRFELSTFHFPLSTSAVSGGRS